jgi:hypothetical protein
MIKILAIATILGTVSLYVGNTLLGKAALGYAYARKVAQERKRYQK